ncbi:hypothetical protein [Halomonas sp. SpR8]|uniref:hypothetical protein n=1 Tax=Halomonas sp. SpR8 TaxID=3050463 RepID=UPI0027E45075|nr:hypothetical protein [Halomonas sp. SpR8]MDQ7729449.1 hypothetical protein [Halomonas sp. SpR8]
MEPELEEGEFEDEEGADLVSEGLVSEDLVSEDLVSEGLVLEGVDAAALGVEETTLLFALLALSLGLSALVEAVSAGEVLV